MPWGYDRRRNHETWCWDNMRIQSRDRELPRVPYDIVTYTSTLAFSTSCCTHQAFTSHLLIRARDYGQWTIILSVIWNLKGIRKKTLNERANEPTNIWQTNIDSKKLNSACNMSPCNVRFIEMAVLHLQHQHCRTFSITWQNTELTGTAHCITHRAT